MRRLGTFVFWTLALLVLPMAASATNGGATDPTWGYALGAGIAIGIAGLGCGIGMGLTAGNTTAGIARNPGAAGSMFTNFIIALALIESVAIYALVIGILLVLRIPT